MYWQESGNMHHDTRGNVTIYIAIYSVLFRNCFTWDYLTDAGSIEPHASADVPRVLWRAVTPFCPVKKKTGSQSRWTNCDQSENWIPLMRNRKWREDFNLTEFYFPPGETHEYHRHVGETFIGLTNVGQPRVIQENLLKNESSNLSHKKTKQRQDGWTNMLIESQETKKSVSYLWVTYEPYNLT